VDAAIRLRALRFGFVVLLLSQAVPFILLYATAYLFLEFYVSPTLNQWLGALEALLLVLSLVCSWRGVRRIRQHGDLSGLVSSFRMAMVLGIASLAVTGYQWSTRFVSAGSRFGEIYYMLTGVAGFYTVVGLFILLAISIRALRIPLSRDNYWDAEAANYFWTFQALGALVAYALLYWR